MEPFAGIAHEDLLKLTLLVAVLLGTARLFGEIMRRIGQPAVVGEIMAGVALGPVLIGIAPTVGEWIVPQTPAQAQLLEVVSFFGVMALMIVIGVETDVTLIRSRIKTSAAVGLGGLIVPFFAGAGIALWFPSDLIGSGISRLTFTLFIAVALALSAIPVLAKVLADLDLLKGTFGQTALAAGIIDDLLGWTMLGLVTSLTARGSLSLGATATTVGAVALFFAASLWVAKPVVHWSIGYVESHSQLRDRALTLVIVLAFGWGAVSHTLRLEPILGAFVIGVIVGQSRRLPVEGGRTMESITYGFLAPIFLATAGLKLQFDVLTEPLLLALTVALILVAAAGKLVGCYVGARYIAATSRREALAYGVALNARGVLGIVVASIGMSIGIFGAEVYSMIVITSLVTSISAPIGLRILLRNGPLSTVTIQRPDARRVPFSRRLPSGRRAAGAPGGDSDRQEADDDREDGSPNRRKEPIDDKHEAHDRDLEGGHNRDHRRH